MSDTATPSNSRHHLTHSTVRVMFPTQHHRVGGAGGEGPQNNNSDPEKTQAAFSKTCSPVPVPC